MSAPELDPATATVRQVIDLVVATRPRTLAEALEADAHRHHEAALKCTRPIAADAMVRSQRQALQAAFSVRNADVDYVMESVALLVPTFRISAEMLGFTLPQRAQVMARYHHEGTTDGN